ncbi:MAG: hypothetical protein V4724_15660 [Pseudomonadota bacterium]
MKPFRSPRVLVALVTLFSLLFAQLAVAAYVCPDLNTTKMAARMVHENMPGCQGMDDTAQPGLCHAHCAAGQQSLDLPATPHVAPFIAGELSVILPRIEDGVPALPCAAGSLLLARSTAPPLAIRHCCFRI